MKVLYGNDGFYAIEVKNSATIRLQDLRGLKTFAQDYPQSVNLFIYRGSQRTERDGILCIPVTEFLQSLVPGKALV